MHVRWHLQTQHARLPDTHPEVQRTLRLLRKMRLSPGSGYFHASSSGAPTLVRTRNMSLTPRPSCWKVAIFFESGDQVSTGSSLCTQPALFVA